MRQYEQAVHDFPSFPEAHFNLAAALSAKGNIDEARRHYESAIEARPDYVKALNNLGMLLFNQARFTAAETQFRRRRRQCRLCDGSEQPGHRADGSGHSPGRRAFRKAIALDPDFASPKRIWATFWAAWKKAPRRSMRWGLSPPRSRECQGSLLARRRLRPDARLPGRRKNGRNGARVAQSAGQADLAAEIQQRIELYRRSQLSRQ